MEAQLAARGARNLKAMTTDRPAHAVRSDASLLADVAERKDREAFSLLYERFGQAGFALAYRITGNSDEAEEAFQEAMLRVWLSAGNFDPRGNAKGWILKIVARESMDVARKRQRRSRLQEREAERERAVPGIRSHPALAGSNELVQSLRGMVDRLPAKERHLLALYYSGGFSQDEIAEQLSISQRSVSYRIQQILANLRQSIEQAGLAAALPLLDGAALGDAMLGGPPLPAGLKGAIVARLPDLARASTRVPPHVAPAFALKAAAAAFLGLAVLGAVLWLRPSASSLEASPGAGAAASEASLPGAPGVESVPAPADAHAAASGPKGQPQVEAQRAVLKHWDFERGEPKEGLAVMEGSWTWRSSGGPDRSGCMETGPEALVVDLGLTEADLPLEVDLQIFTGIGTHWPRKMAAGVGWKDYASVASFGNLRVPVAQESAHPEWLRCKVYLSAGACDTWSNGQREGMLLYRNTKLGKLYFLSQGRVWLGDLKITKIPPEDVPDLRAFTDAIERIPAGKRKGRFGVPGLSVPGSSESASVLFVDWERAAPDAGGKAHD